MTNFFSRTRSDWFLGLWAAAPAFGIPVLVVYWWHRTTAAFDAFDFSYDPIGTWTLIAFLACGAVYLASIAILINDVWARAIPTAQQVVWTVVTLCTAPAGGVVYWLVRCRR